MSGPYYTAVQIEKNIAELKERVKDPSEWKYVYYMFRRQTVRVLAMKYCYYVLNKYWCHDDQYDAEEKTWYVMGRALGELKEEETSVCIDFDESHPMAKRAIFYAHAIKEKQVK